jgi:hypothetical protein
MRRNVARHPQAVNAFHEVRAREAILSAFGARDGYRGCTCHAPQHTAALMNKDRR